MTTILKDRLKERRRLSKKKILSLFESFKYFIDEVLIVGAGGNYFKLKKKIKNGNCFISKVPLPNKEVITFEVGDNMHACYCFWNE